VSPDFPASLASSFKRALRALLVSYAFPPVGGAGVQRVAKLAKYLPVHGVRPAVLTVANPSVPVRDESLLADLPAGLEVARARTLEPGYGAKQAAWAAPPESLAVPSLSSLSSLPSLGSLRQAAAGVARNLLFPDPQVLWQPAAQAALLSRIAARRDDVVLVSGPPFSQFLLAPLARAAGLGVVLDYRDEWSTVRERYEMGRSGVARVLGDPLEAALLRGAHAVVTATEEFRTRLLERFSFLDAGRVVAIPNGYDPDDFPPDLPEPPGDRFVMTYAGTVFSLTSARGLLGAVRRLHAAEPKLAQALSLRFLGRIVPTELDAFEGSAALGVERVGYVPHARVLHELSASHLALCILDDVPGNERIYPAKIFELMHLGRPVLTLAPRESALARLARAHGLGDVVPPRDEEAIAAAVAEHLRAFARGENRTAPWRNAPTLRRFDRRALAGEFAQVLRDAALQGRRRGWPGA
jgi:glycosyltransferase involved in cell wall biosynthesis